MSTLLDTTNTVSGARADRARSLRIRILGVSLVACCLLAIGATGAAARVATLTFTGIGQITSVGGDFASAGFMNGDIVDMTIEIEETTVGAGGAFNDPTSITTFVRQSNPATTISFTGFGFAMADATRLDQASMPTAAEGTYWVSGVIRDWDLTNINPAISDTSNLFTILRELPNAGIGNVSADGFEIGAPDSTGGNVTEFASLKPSIALTTGCGNGVVDAGEACDDPFCCDATCDNAVSDGTECRAKAGDCDVAEMCAGGACPTDALVPAATECRVSAGDCDVAEECTGTDVDCPPDTLSQFTCGTICRPAQGACDTADFCESYAATGSLDCPGEVTLCTPTSTATATNTPTASATPTATATRVPEGGVCVDTGECEVGLTCVAGTCTDLAIPAPVTSMRGLVIALAIMMFAAYLVLVRGRKVR